MKNVMVVNRKGKAVAVVPTGEPIIVKGVGSFVGIKAINACLKDIPVEAAGETVHFYVPDMLAGITTGASIEYVKTGKTGTGTALTAEEVEDFKEFYKLYAERILNVRFSLAKYAKDQSLIQLRTKAWNLLSQTNTVATPTNTIIDPDKELREALGKKMLEAIDSGNMELYAILKAERDKLKAPEVVANSAPKVEYDASKWEDKATYITPSSRNTVANDTNTVNDNNDTDITEVPEEAEGNIAW